MRDLAQGRPYLHLRTIFFFQNIPQTYPKRLAFLFLSELKSQFQDEMRREFGTGVGIDYRSKIETIDKPYYFIRFERTIMKKQKEFKVGGQGLLRFEKMMKQKGFYVGGSS